MTTMLCLTSINANLMFHLPKKKVWLQTLTWIAPKLHFTAYDNCFEHIFAQSDTVLEHSVISRQLCQETFPTLQRDLYSKGFVQKRAADRSGNTTRLFLLLRLFFPHHHRNPTDSYPQENSYLIIIYFNNNNNNNILTICIPVLILAPTVQNYYHLARVLT